MRFLIYGAGALGQALGCMLSAGGHQVDLLLRPRFLTRLQNSGLRVRGIFGEFTANPGRLGLYCNIRAAGHGYDFILLTTKSYDTPAAVQDLARLKEPKAVYVSMQNGCGNVEQLAETFGDDCSLGGRVITGFEIKEPGLVEITVSADAIHIGSSKPEQETASASILAQTISEAGHPCIAVPDIHQSLYAKLLYNCSLNPLGAILGVHYGLLGEHEETRGLMNQVIEETFTIIKAHGGKTSWKSAKDYENVFYSTLLPATYNHRPSMLQDLENRKPTEIEALTGYVGKLGEHYGITTPACNHLTALIRFREALNVAQEDEKNGVSKKLKLNG